MNWIAIILIILSLFCVFMLVISIKDDGNGFLDYCREKGGAGYFQRGEYYCEKDGKTTYHGNVDTGWKP